MAGTPWLPKACSDRPERQNSGPPSCTRPRQRTALPQTNHPGLYSLHGHLSPSQLPIARCPSPVTLSSAATCGVQCPQLHRCVSPAVCSLPQLMTTRNPHRLAHSCPSHRTYHTMTRFTLDSGSYMVSSHSTHSLYMDSCVTLGKWHPDPRHLVSGKGLVTSSMEKHAPSVLLIPVWTISAQARK